MPASNIQIKCATAYVKRDARLESLRDRTERSPRGEAIACLRMLNLQGIFCDIKFLAANLGYK
ncbi:hypothetical protein [Calothrix sp. UHCC 0171]|uniref:hypothetical protein n=1 Tax=Calothrix sp. UHCC 0171 TaxID=3110245 RepID=UPI002B1F9FB6|nr:hypothetical protein [Calothrix sp. UHCC 0171]MEA5571099.1 hypothetical protein [Calothrix sp. UHCC 0171]